MIEAASREALACTDVQVIGSSVVEVPHDEARAGAKQADSDMFAG